MNDDQITVSIITVVYNGKKTIEQTILSVLNQTDLNIEYIVVDGDSNDGTIEILQKYEPIFAGKGIAYKYVSEPDKGIYDAMNKGIGLCTGKWIGIINSDDFYEKNAIEIIRGTLNSNPSVELIYGNLNLISETSTLTLVKPDPNIDLLRQTMTISHPTVFVRKDIYEKFGVFSLQYRLCADWDLILRLYVKGAKFFYTNKTIANFRSGGAGSGFKKIHLKERFKIRNDHGKKMLYWYNIKDLLIYLYFQLPIKKE